jgi:hypothetical protein
MTATTAEILTRIDQALAELDAMPPERARRVADQFIRTARMLVACRQPVAAGVGGDAPIFLRLWHEMPGWAKAALALYVAGAIQEAGADSVRLLKAGIRSLAGKIATAAPESVPSQPPVDCAPDKSDEKADEDATPKTREPV